MSKRNFTTRAARLYEAVQAGGIGPVAKRRFRSLIWDFYAEQGRDLPWRRVDHWYPILVSEVMLQQTQVERVLPKYREFLRNFPNPHSLARAEQAEVIRQWQGLGYNRRAKALQESTRTLLTDFRGKLPESSEEVRRLPGIGSYTSAALVAFVYNKPEVLIETNIRTVIIHCFMREIEEISEQEIQEIAQFCLPIRHSRHWHYALMDYGAHLKREGYRYNRQVQGYRPQSSFVGSNRQIRGALISLLSAHAALSESQIGRRLEFETDRVSAALRRLVAEGMVAHRAGKYCLA